MSGKLTNGDSAAAAQGAFRRAVVYSCFFVSGMAGLIYEILWSKYLALYCGSTGLAQVIVLAVFMGGLAVGSRLLGPVADRVRNPLKLYAFLELGVGLYALGFGAVYTAGRSVFLALAAGGGLDAGSLTPAKIVSCAMTILPPTILMGGTLPALARFTVRSSGAIGSGISRLYFLNALGAVLGCLVSGFWLIGAFGLPFTMLVGAILNVAVGTIAFLASGAVSPFAEETVGESADRVSGPVLSRRSTAVLVAGVTISGAVSMVYEVAWIRLLALVMGSSTYSFSIMLATFILGLSIGSMILSGRKKTSGYGMIFALSEIGVGASVLLALPFYVRLPYAFNQLASSLSREPATFGLYQFCMFLVCAIVMILPTIFQGITLPAAIRAAAPAVAGLGRRVGFVYAMNTLGTLTGAICGGFVCLPLLGIKGAIELGVALNFAVGIAVLIAVAGGRERRIALAAAAGAMAVAASMYVLFAGQWDRQVISSGVYRSRGRVPSYAELRDASAKRTTLFYRDGVDATIAVQDTAETPPDRVLVINGKADASAVADLATQKGVAHIPMLLHPAPKNVLVIGLGSGATVGSILAYDSVRRVDVVEISKDVIEASRFFESVNGAFWKDDRVRVFHEDAKTFLEVSRERYDVIVSEPTNPWIAGVAGLFSVEYMRACVEHLTPGGLFMEWVHLYEMEDRTVFLILETFTSEFPCYTVWNPAKSDVVLVGSPSPYRPAFDDMRRRVSEPAVRRDLARIGIASPATVLSLQMANHSSSPRHARWLGMLTSDLHPVLEYMAPRGFFLQTSAAVAGRFLDERMRSPANCRLWLREYERLHGLTVADLQDCYLYSQLYPSTISGIMGYVWANEWASRFPDDPLSHAAAARLAPKTHSRGIEQADEAYRRAANDADRLTIGRTACRLRFEDYLATRNFMAKKSAPELLAMIVVVADLAGDKADHELLYWKGKLEFDVGAYEEAAADLGKAAREASRRGAAQGDRIAIGLTLCDALRATGRTDDALSAWNEYLAPFWNDLIVHCKRVELLTAAEHADGNEIKN